MILSGKHLPLEEDVGRISSAFPVPLSFEPFSATRYPTGQKVELIQVNVCVLGAGRIQCWKES